MQKRIPDELIEAARLAWRDCYERDKHKGIICPICDSGSGPDGTGITENPKKPGQLHCWDCGFSGSIFDLVIRDETNPVSTFADAVEFVLDRMGRTVEYVDATNGTTRASRSTRDTDTTTSKASLSGRLPEDAYQLDAPASQPGRDYLASRGISTDTAIRFGLLYHPSWRPRRGDGTLISSAPMSPRIIVPCGDTGYLARDIRSPEAIPTESRKYVKQRQGAAGILNLAALHAADPVIVVEGEFDALSIAEVGHSAVSIGGTSNLRLLLDAIDQISPASRAPLILALDDDDAGRKRQAELSTELAGRNISYSEAEITLGCKDVNEALCKNRVQFQEAVASAVRERNLMDLRAWHMTKRIDAIEAIWERGAYEPIPTGIKGLDDVIGGLRPGITVLSGRTGTGKSHLALAMADHIASTGIPVLYVSEEMDAVDLAARSTARLAHEIAMDHFNADSPPVYASYTDVRIAKHQDLTVDGLNRYKSAVLQNLYIMDDVDRVSVSNMSRVARRIKNAYGRAPVVMVDYMQLMPVDTENSNMSDKSKVDSVVIALRALSRELCTPILVVSSMNRAAYSAAHQETYDQTIDVLESSGKETGAIEYYAEELLCLLVRSWGEVTDVDLYVVKNRSGRRPTHEIRLSFFGATGLFMNRKEKDEEKHESSEDTKEKSEQLAFTRTF